MRVIAVSTLRDFWQRYPDTEQPLKARYEEAANATWTQPADIKAQYRSASVLKNRRLVFSIKDNDYRLIVAVPSLAEQAAIASVFSDMGAITPHCRSVQQPLNLSVVI